MMCNKTDLKTKKKMQVVNRYICIHVEDPDWRMSKRTEYIGERPNSLVIFLYIWTITGAERQVHIYFSGERKKKLRGDKAHITVILLQLK